VRLFHLHNSTKAKGCRLPMTRLTGHNAQRVRQPDARLRRALRASPQSGAGCG
jgi:hypothetical protein